MSKSLSHCLTRGMLAVASAGCLLAAAPASAAVVGTFDPEFNSGFDNDTALNNVGFRGSITLEVSSGCAAFAATNQIGSFGLAFNGSNGCSVSVDSAQIIFYNFASGPNAVLSTINLTPSTFAVSPFYVDSMTFDSGGNFAGMTTEDSLAFPVLLNTGGFNYNGSMLLYFYDNNLETDPAVLVNCNNPITFEGGRFEGAAAAAAPTCNSSGFQNSRSATVTFASTVPEPDGVALAALGLAALVATRRRRSSMR